MAGFIHTLQSRLNSLSLSDDEDDDLKIYPTHSEIFREFRPAIVSNKVNGPYSSVEEYLKIQYDLLREDFLGPLRDEMTIYEKFQCKSSLQYLHFHEVRFTRKGAKYDLTCYHMEILSKLDPNIMAPDSKRLITGSFVLFYYNELRTVIYGKVEDSDLRYKKLLVSLHPNTKIKFNKKYTMIEYMVFFEPYYSALKTLRGMSGSTFPMKRYIVDLNLSVKRPSYLMTRKIVIEKNLNPSQFNAMENALNKEFVLIQGPPGTGKTFLGLKIVKHLINEHRNEGPILVVTYKNHALDQFLEGLLDTTEDIIRLGGQSKNPKMAGLSIKKQRNRLEERLRLCGKPVLINSAISSCYKRYSHAEEKLKSLGRQLDMINSGEVVVKFSKLSIPSLNSNWDNMENESINMKWLLQNEEGDNDKLSNKVVSLLSLLRKSGTTWLFTTSIVKILCKEIDNILQKKPLSLAISLTLRKISNDIELQELKKLLLTKVAELKSCMTSDAPSLNIDQLSQAERGDPFKIPVHKRWLLYKTWINAYIVHLRADIDSAVVRYKKAYKEFDQVSLPDNIKLMKKMKVIGMTTTCAARMRETLEMLQCSIVVIEEAAEVLEAHVVSAVTKHCKHLILIGDHQQLRPAVADYEIETKYHLGVSLFERMVTNGVECHTLDVQHRMRPEISSLIVPAIYPNLEDHESVSKYRNVRGIDGNVFFLDHAEPEAHAGECSKRNDHEVRFFVKLAEYLLKNRYKPEQITILAAYTGQVSALNKEKRSSSYEEMKNIAVKSVDDYQGEENKIILLSLVRNNKESKIGFLSNKQRVCVALSRAREGLYIMGNMKHLASRSTLWKQIEESLKTQNAVGTKMRLKCRAHGRITSVDSSEDFDVVQEGGCTEKCNKELTCGHVCSKMCHGLDRSHIAEYSCTEKCERYPCPIHPKTRCNKLCGEDCGPCKNPTEKELGCGHFAKCYMLTSEEDTPCEEVFKLTLTCKVHYRRVQCSVKADSSIICSTCKDDPKK